MHPDPQIQQLKIGLAGTVGQSGYVDLVLIGHDEDAIASFVGNQGIEGDRGLCSFLAQEEAAAIVGRGFEGEITRRTDRGKFSLYRH